MTETILASMQAGGPLFWALFTIANTCLVARFGYFLFDQYDACKAARQWAKWQRKYEPGEIAQERRKFETKERMSGFAKGLQALCNEYGFNVEASSGIAVRDRAVQQEGYRWHAIFAGCDTRGVYNLVNPGWFE
jgi:hypothetical protein